MVTKRGQRMKAAELNRQNLFVRLRNAGARLMLPYL
jgi:hypothetical protein